MLYYVDFEGWIAISAKSRKEAQNLFWEWESSIKKWTYYDGTTSIKDMNFRYEGVEEEEPETMREELLGRIVKIYGLEHPITIAFAHLIESDISDKDLETLVKAHEEFPIFNDEE